MLILGHRGACGDAPENTLQAFQLAIEHGADGIECDLIQHDTQCYIIHDHRLDRTTNATGKLINFSHQELMVLDAGNNESIPTMDALLNWLPANTLCNIELKYLTDSVLFCSQLKQIISNHNIDISQLLVSSFHHGWLNQISQQFPTLPLAYLIAHYPQNLDSYIQSIPASTLNVALDVLDKEMVLAAHRNNKKVLVYTVNHIDDIAECKKMGVDGIFTNYPLRASRIR
ncbi:glycerophosphodiester phosphodiesterase [Alteromonas sp. 5E99-2]|uniref:glycerophosphodiester phosphodiesterase n=1 Tax=Alteromonas sp. 5E99-2 TaxID=2817683 RepID=UPI001A98CDAF|nr:glycerophosphodiester phosphodiesterase family protein [Alteromonas sp. 5E99-2]MBO1254607.1 glycerophosphodiester phosphodiesterase [Alteromonas sp. 5E99-2]